MKKLLNKNFIVLVISLGLALAVFIFLISVNIIGSSVKAKCQLAKEKYGDSCLESLIAWLDDESNSYKSRNEAIWALGELGDEAALPVLEKYYTGQIPDREPLAAGISQYELKKAVNLASGGFNATAFFWRYGEAVE